MGGIGLRAVAHIRSLWVDCVRNKGGCVATCLFKRIEFAMPTESVVDAVFEREAARRRREAAATASRCRAAEPTESWLGDKAKAALHKTKSAAKKAASKVKEGAEKAGEMAADAAEGAKEMASEAAEKTKEAGEAAVEKTKKAGSTVMREAAFAVA